MHTNAASELRAAWEKFEASPFPESSSDEDLNEIHSSLALYDADVAGAVSRIVNGTTMPPSMATVLDFDEELEGKVLELVHARSRAAAEACAYLQYLRRIRHLVELARAAVEYENDRDT
jgi:hypothetical protein